MFVVRTFKIYFPRNFQITELYLTNHQAAHCGWLCIHSVMSDSAAPWTVACQAPLSMEFLVKNTRVSHHFPTPGNLPNSRIRLLFLASPALAGRFFTTSTAWEAHTAHYIPTTCFLIILHYRLLQDTEYKSLYCISNPCCLAILCIVVCVC